MVSGGLDDALARMDRWEALRLRMSGGVPERGDPVVDELIEVIGPVLRRYGPVIVTLAVEGVGHATTVRIGWHDGQLTVDRVATGAGALPGHETESADQTAARLAELIRQDPSLLRRDGVTD